MENKTMAEQRAFKKQSCTSRILITALILGDTAMAGWQGDLPRLRVGKGQFQRQNGALGSARTSLQARVLHQVGTVNGG